MDQEKIWAAFQNDPALAESFKAARFRHSRLISLIARQTGGGVIDPDLKILNIGVGDGGFEALLADRGVKIYSLDPDESAISRINQLTNRAKCGYSQKIPFDEAFFDFVVMSEVIEHLSDSAIAETLGEIKRVLRSGGNFFGTTPAEENLVNSICVCPKCGERFHKFGHLQSFSRSRLAETLDGFFTEVKIAREYLDDPKRLNTRGKIAWFLRNALIKVGSFGQGEQFVWAARS
ncbi:MAG: class I SAM-dependent methyltransferase [Helicobacteraceae bacterium]|nr:class I SAM-dependent methyltransferase [Helicobacteraceae bacterium]